MLCSLLDFCAELLSHSEANGLTAADIGLMLGTAVVRPRPGTPGRSCNGLQTLFAPAAEGIASRGECFDTAVLDVPRVAKIFENMLLFRTDLYRELTELVQLSSSYSFSPCVYCRSARVASVPSPPRSLRAVRA